MNQKKVKALKRISANDAHYQALKEEYNRLPWIIRSLVKWKRMRYASLQPLETTETQKQSLLTTDVLKSRKKTANKVKENVKKVSLLKIQKEK